MNGIHISQGKADLKEKETIENNPFAGGSPWYQSLPYRING
jgi:hypothetical protein